MNHEPMNDADDGDLRDLVRALAVEVRELNANTAGMVEAWQSAGKLIGVIKWAGNLVKWFAIVAAPVVALWIAIRGKIP